MSEACWIGGLIIVTLIWPLQYFVRDLQKRVKAIEKQMPEGNTE